MFPSIPLMPVLCLLLIITRSMFAALPAYPGLEAGEGGDLAEPPLAEDARQRAGVLLVPGLCPPRLLVQGIHLVRLHHGGLMDKNGKIQEIFLNLVLYLELATMSHVSAQTEGPRSEQKNRIIGLG